MEPPILDFKGYYFCSIFQGWLAKVSGPEPNFGPPVPAVASQHSAAGERLVTKGCPLLPPAQPERFGKEK